MFDLMSGAERVVNYPTLAGDAGDYRTYEIDSPPDRDIVWTCQEVKCEAWRKGWVVLCDMAGDLGKARAVYFRSGESGRSYRETTHVRDGVTYLAFVFDAYQRCFQDHRTKPVAFSVQLGDRRIGHDQRPTIRDHSRPQDFVEDFALHQLSIAERVQKYLGNTKEKVS